MLPLYACFFVSGACALVYEVVWQRMLTLVFGLSTFSVAAVIAAFLAGLALGARLFGGLVDRSPNLIRVYAGIELGIAVAGWASGYLIAPLMQAFKLLHAAADPGWLGSNILRFGLAFIAFGVPSILIGATVPVMARLVAQASRSVAVGFGRFYAVNTAGSVMGAALAGFVLIRMVGVQGALHVAVLGNVTVAVLLLIVGRGGVPGQAADHRAAIETDQVQAEEPLHTQFALAIAVVTGAVGLAYEIAWTRVLAIFTLNSVYVFTMVVTVYLAALATGSAIAARLMQRRSANRLRMLIGVQVALALTGPIVIACIPAAAGLGVADPGMTGTQVFLLEYAVAGAIVFLPTVLIGMTLPILVGMFCESTARAGQAVGRIYAWNAAGTILGAAVTGVLLIPSLGLRGTLLGLAAVSFLIAAVAAAMDRNPPPLWRGATQCAAGVFVLLVALLPATTHLYRPAGIPNETVIYYAEGPSATVHVSEFGGDQGSHRTLFVDSNSVAGTYEEIVTDQKMLAHLPLLLHREPKHALTVGFGTGGTSYSMLLHKVRVDCVEIEPRVPETYRFFKSENKGMVGPDHERFDFHLILDDARSWLHVAPYKYDLIVTDVTNIQYRGNGNLYTTDYFRLMQSRLEPDGLGCAWVPISGITPEQLKILIRSFHAVYPNTSVWYMINLPTDFAILVGTPKPLRLDLDDLATRMSRPLVHRDLAQIGMDNPYKLVACLLLAGEDVTAYAGDGPLHTDDRPVLDYLTHAVPYRNTLTANLTEMLTHRSDPSSCFARWPNGGATDQAMASWQNWYDAAGRLMAGHAMLRSTDPDRAARAAELYEAAAALTPDDPMTKSLAAGLQSMP